MKQKQRSSSYQDNSISDLTKMAKGGAVTFVGRLAGRGLQVLAQAALARLLGPEAFGLYAIGWALLYLGGLTEPLGLDRGTIKYGTQYWKKDDARFKGVFLESLALGLVTGGLIGVGFTLLAPFLADSIFHKPNLGPVIQVLAIAFPLKTGLTVCAATTRISQNMKYSTYSSDIVQPLSNVVLILAFYALGWGLAGAVLATALSFGIGFVLALYYALRLFPAVTRSNIRPLFTGKDLIVYSVPTAMAAALADFTNRADRLMVGLFLPAAVVGAYQAASQTSLLMSAMLGSISMVMSPMIVELYHVGESQRLDEIFKVSTKWSLYLSIPLCIVMVFLPKDTLTVLFGPGYEGGATALQILATVQLFNAGTGAVGSLLTMTGYQNRWLVISAIALVVDIVTGVALIPTFGLVGAAIASASSIFVLFVAGLLQIRSTLHLWPYDLRYVKGGGAALVASGVVTIVSGLMLTSALVRILVCGLLSVIIFGAVLWALGMDTEDQGILKLVWPRRSSTN